MQEEDYMDDEADIYEEREAEDLLENDEVSPEEEAFMKGYDEEDEAFANSGKDEEEE